MIFFTSAAKKTTSFLVASLFLATASFALTPVKVAVNIPGPVGQVVYQSIKVSVTDKSVILDWNTASEFMNGYFEVERSFNNADFKTIALVLDGFSTEGTGKRYAFKEDVAVAKSGRSVYYRLKQFDENGNVSYSTAVKAL
ncbi:MAG: hypothetical protein JNM14_08005 [Ferruginibacter sp.]|nr:hypothetical protein [Ferruginibacter sp.]